MIGLKLVTLRSGPPRSGHNPATVDDFPGHVGIVREIKESTEFPGKIIVVCYWPFLDKEIAFFEDSLDLV